jgi:hypothetical protein
VTEQEKLMRAYLKTLAAKDPATVIALFDAAGVVESPLYGRKSAVEFYRKLASDTQGTELELQKLFFSTGDPGQGAIHFRYTWTMATGETVVFPCVDLFEFTGTPVRIDKLTIVYDTYPIRKAFGRLRGGAANRSS